jgi:hypothetical protein
MVPLKWSGAGPSIKRVLKGERFSKTISIFVN